MVEVGGSLSRQPGFKCRSLRVFTVSVTVSYPNPGSQIKASLSEVKR